MSRDEALTATLNAARALRRYGCTNELLAQLYSAIDAVDSDGDADAYPAPCPTCADLRAQLAELRGDRPGLCSNAECFRVADLPSGTCHHHSAVAQRPHPWQRAGLRSGVFAVEQDDE